MGVLTQRRWSGASCLVMGLSKGQPSLCFIKALTSSSISPMLRSKSSSSSSLALLLFALEFSLFSWSFDARALRDDLLFVSWSSSSSSASSTSPLLLSSLFIAACLLPKRLERPFFAESFPFSFSGGESTSSSSCTFLRDLPPLLGGVSSSASSSSESITGFRFCDFFLSFLGLGSSSSSSSSDSTTRSFFRDLDEDFLDGGLDS